MLESRQTRTKVIATLGPASCSLRRIRELIQAGVDGLRINMSHGTPEERELWITRAQRLRASMKRPVAILIDLRGPRLRLGSLKEPRTLRRREEVGLVNAKAERGAGLPVDYRRLATDLKPGHRVLLRDGRVELKVKAVEGRRVVCRVVRGGTVSSNQGVNLPDTEVSAPTLSAQDRKDIAFAARVGADWLAMSFVEGPEDLRAVRRAAARHGFKVPVMAKIERPEAIRNLDAIIAESDAVMVARGDLAVELGQERVPYLQKRTILRCLDRAVPVVVATQMLESMVESSTPTRAEVSDVANAVFDRADAVMLSGETAVGAYPLRAARTMQRILTATETQLYRSADRRRREVKSTPPGETAVEMATVDAAVTAARQADARVIVAFTESGRSARLVSSFRSSRPLVGLTMDERSFHRMALFWGVHPAWMGRVSSVDAMYRSAAKTLTGARWLRSTDLAVGITGTFAISGATNTIRLLPISELGRASGAKRKKRP